MNNIFDKTVFSIVAIVLSLGLAACRSGGGDGDSGGGFAVGNTGVTGISSGAITGFGSVIMNNSTYGVNASTAVTLNGEVIPSNQHKTHLTPGMVALVEFEGEDSTTINVDNEIKGRVDSVNTSENSMVVMGVLVIVDQDTLFKNAQGKLSNFSAGNFAEIHGFFDISNNSIRAALVEKLAVSPSPGEFEVKGVVSKFNNPVDTFSIGSLTVNYSAIKPLDAGIGNEVFVEVKGTLTGGNLAALAIELEDEFPDLNPNDELEIQGVISYLDDPDDPAEIVVNNQTIIINGTTEFINGGVTDLALSIKVEVEGFVNSTGSFVAEKIKFEDSIRIETQVKKQDGIITAFQVITINTTSFTEIEDDNGNIITAADINDGDYLEIKGFRGAGNSVTAIEIEVDNGDRSILKGPVDTIASPDLIIMGVTVSTVTGTTEFKIGETAVDQAGFFSTVQTGNIVKAREDTLVTTSSIKAKQVEFDNDDDDDDD